VSMGMRQPEGCTAWHITVPPWMTNSSSVVQQYQYNAERVTGLTGSVGGGMGWVVELENGWLASPGRSLLSARDMVRWAQLIYGVGRGERPASGQAGKPDPRAVGQG
jgi:hypothetical protein